MDNENASAEICKKAWYTPEVEVIEAEETAAGGGGGPDFASELS